MTDPKPISVLHPRRATPRRAGLAAAAPYLAVALAAGLAACTGFPRNEPGKGLGQITVNNVHMEGRDRLINDRREQEQWISKQIDEYDKTPLAINGLTDQRSLSAIAAQAAVNLDPAIKLDAINRGRVADQARQDADDATALNAMRTAQRDSILADVKSGKLTYDEGVEKLKKLGLDPSTAKSPAAATAASSPAGVPAKPDGSLMGVLKDGKYTPPDGSPRQTSASSSFLEDFYERISGRETMMNIRNDVRMDDLHDLGGKTLYRLTMTASVLPEDDASAWAIARVKLRLPVLDENTIGLTLERARRQFEKQLSERVWTLERTLLLQLTEKCWDQENAKDRLTALPWADEAHERAFRRAMRCATSETSSRARTALEQILAKTELTPLADPGDEPPAWRGKFQERLQKQDAFLNREAPKKSVRRLQRWGVWLGDLMERYRKAQVQASILSCLDAEPQSPSSVANEFDKPDCTRVTGSSPAQKLAELLKASVTASVYAVTPRETVQRLSEVASNRQAAEFIASLSGLAGPTGISAGLQSLRVSDAYYAALRRQPLVVGFTEVSTATLKVGGTRTPQEDACLRQALARVDEPVACDERNPKELVFGWVLGPIFQISNDGKKTRFRHTVVQRSVSADLVLPAWLDRIDVIPETYWLREDGRTAPTTACANPMQPGCQPPQWAMKIDLPAQPVEVLYAADSRMERAPRVEKFQYLDVVAGQPALVRIAGQNVWRSTEVLIGSQRANSVYVLKDGVVATFDAILPAYGADTKGGSGPDSGDVALTLITSDGSVEAGRVSIKPAKDKDAGDDKPPKLTFTGAVPRIVAGLEYPFELSQALKAGESLAVRIGSKQDIALNVLLEQAAIQVNEDRKHVIFTLPAASVSKLKAGNSIVADVRITRAGGNVDSYTLIKDGAYYEKAENLEATATAARAKPEDPIQLTLSLPPGSLRGFASLATGGAAQVSASLTIDADAPIAIEASCPLKDATATTCQAELKLPDSSPALPHYKTVGNDKLKLKLSLKGNDVPKLKSGDLTVP